MRNKGWHTRVGYDHRRGDVILPAGNGVYIYSVTTGDRTAHVVLGGDIQHVFDVTYSDDDVYLLVNGGNDRCPLLAVCPTSHKTKWRLDTVAVQKPKINYAPYITTITLDNQPHAIVNDHGNKVVYIYNTTNRKLVSVLPWIPGCDLTGDTQEPNMTAVDGDMLYMSCRESRKVYRTRVWVGMGLEGEGGEGGGRAERAGVGASTGEGGRGGVREGGGGVITAGEGEGTGEEGGDGQGVIPGVRGRRGRGGGRAGNNHGGNPGECETDGEGVIQGQGHAEGHREEGGSVGGAGIGCTEGEGEGESGGESEGDIAWEVVLDGNDIGGIPTDIGVHTRHRLLAVAIDFTRVNIYTLQPTR